jgi:hypothetical protein
MRPRRVYRTLLGLALLVAPGCAAKPGGPRAIPPPVTKDRPPLQIPEKGGLITRD